MNRRPCHSIPHMYIALVNIFFGLNPPVSGERASGNPEFDQNVSKLFHPKLELEYPQSIRPLLKLINQPVNAIINTNSLETIMTIELQNQ